MTDDEFRKKLQSATEAYKGEQTEEAIFNNVLVPIAGEYGVTATFEEFKEYMSSLEDGEMNKDELKMVAGGSKGCGVLYCIYAGLGVGGTSNGGCLVVGGSDGYTRKSCCPPSVNSRGQ